MKTAKQHVQGFISESGLPIVLAGAKTAIGALKASLAVWIQNQNTMQDYPDSEDKCQTMACNAMRTEAGIKFLPTPYSGK